MTLQNSDTQLILEEVHVLKTALEDYIQNPEGSCLLKPYAKKALKKL